MRTYQSLNFAFRRKIYSVIWNQTIEFLTPCEKIQVAYLPTEHHSYDVMKDDKLLQKGEVKFYFIRKKQDMVGFIIYVLWESWSSHDCDASNFGIPR